MILTTVIRPTLTPEERAKRMEEIKRTAVRLVLETEKAKILRMRGQQNEQPHHH